MVRCRQNYLFVIVSYNCSVVQHCLAAFLVGTHFLFAALSVFGVHFIIFFIIVRFFTPLIVLGEGLCAMLSAWLLNNVMISITPEE